MQKNRRQFGMTLTEILVVIAVMAILMSISVPTAKKLMNSFDASTGTRRLINAALSNGRAIAVREQAYAGVRFQQDYHSGQTYMIFIVHDTPENMGGLANGFRAVVGRKPMKLPEDIRVDGAEKTAGCAVVFSPAGKLVNHEVWVRNKDGVADDSSNDMIFNTEANVNNADPALRVGQFVQDSANGDSIQGLTIRANDWSSTEHISPYTGELVIEYK